MDNVTFAMDNVLLPWIHHATICHGLHIPTYAAMDSTVAVTIKVMNDLKFMKVYNPSTKVHELLQ